MTKKEHIFIIKADIKALQLEIYHAKFGGKKELSREQNKMYGEKMTELILELKRTEAIPLTKYFVN